MKVYLLKFIMPNKVVNYGVIAYLSYEEAFISGMECLMKLEPGCTFEVMLLKQQKEKKK